MNLFIITFQAVAALLGIGILGFWIIGRRRLPSAALGLLTSIAIDISLPCLVLSNLLSQFSPRQYPTWWLMPVWWLAFSAISLGLSIATSFLIKKGSRGEFVMSLVFQNGIFFPLIIISGLFKNPQSYLVVVFLFLILQPSTIFSTYPFFFGKNGQSQTLNWRRVINPALVMTLLGIILGLGGVSHQVPTFILTILTLVGAMSIPLFMLILGGNIYNDFMYQGKEGRKIYIKEAVIFTLIKTIFFPLVALGFLIWLRPSFTIAFVVLLEAAVPPITAVPLFAERSGGNRALASQFIVASFLFSIISIPAMVSLFNIFFPFPS